MKLTSISLHPEFPKKAWIIVEQSRNEPYRFIFNSASNTFSRSSFKSLVYERGFSGVYGWVGGSGSPPEPHHDILLLTNQFPSCGDIVLGHVCGVFLREDNDNKFLAVDDEIRQSMSAPDIKFLDKSYYEELLRLYPRIGDGEGWHGSEVAIALLLKKPLHN